MQLTLLWRRVLIGLKVRSRREEYFMSNVTVTDFAETLNVSVDKLLEQLDEAGIKAVSYTHLTLPTKA